MYTYTMNLNPPPPILVMDKYSGLDPLSTIIKLAILGTKPLGTKIHVHKNTITIHEPKYSQPFLRYMKRANKYDLHLLHDAIEYACCEFLPEAYESAITITQVPAFGSKMIRRKSLTPRQLLPGLFKGAIKGLERLKETYEEFPIITICLKYYIGIIHQNMNNENRTIPLYNHTVVHKLNQRWSGEKIQKVVEKYSSIDGEYELIQFMKEIDTETSEICKT